MRRSTRLRATATHAAATAVKVEGGDGAAVTLWSSTSRLGPKRSLSSTTPGSTEQMIKTEFGGIVVEPRLTTDSRSAHDCDWHDLCAVQELSCVVTLTSGQVFTWQRHSTIDDSWVGVVGEHVFQLREHDQLVQFRLLHPPKLSIECARAVLHDYFRLEIEVAPLYTQWTDREDDMSKIIRSLPGLRIIRQDPVECLFAFICSSNNNIQRITQMITKLKATYGELLFHDAMSEEKFYAFPTVDALASRAEEQTLRDLGFGYRAPFIVKSSKLLQELGGREYLLGLRDIPASGNDDEYTEKLMAFAGVGRKVADCIGLFSLNKLHAIPVDTHVWQIACREFDPSLKSKKSLTPSIYQAVGDHFRARFSPLAGWAHSVLFTGDLSTFQSLLPADIQKKTATEGKTAKKRTATQTKQTGDHSPTHPQRDASTSKRPAKKQRRQL